MAERQWKVGKKFWKKARKCWHCMIEHPDGRRQERRLHADEEEAERIRQDIRKELEKNGVPSLDCSIDSLIQRFLDYTEANRPKATYRWYKNFLSSFGKHIGPALRVSELRIYHVEGWLTKHYPATGNPDTRHAAITCVKRVFNWARKMQFFDCNPLAELHKPAKRCRATCLTREQWDEVLSHYTPDDPFHDFLWVMTETGCRPQEMRVMEARHLDLKGLAVTFADGEIPGKKYGRTVELTQVAADVLKRLALKHPDGPLFRNEDGNPWKQNALNCRFQRLKAKLPFNVHGYVARHSWATDLIEAGASAGAVAVLAGHRDPTTVLKYYGKHIEKRDRHLRGLLETSRKREKDAS